MKLKSWTPLEVIETILAANALAWGVIFLFPGNVFDTPRIKNDAIYAQDWLWGIFLIITSLILLIGPRYKRFWLRRYLQVLCWVFWFSMTALLAFRTLGDGVMPTDFLFLSIFVSIALCHLTLYSRLAGSK